MPPVPIRTSLFDDSTAIILALLVMLLFLLPLDLSVLSFVLLLEFACHDLVALVFFLESLFSSLINFAPHVTDYLCDLSYLGAWVVSLHVIVNFASIQKEG